MIQKKRISNRGFVIFAAAFWAIVVAVVSCLSYLVPVLSGRSCLTRILFGLGFVPGCIAGLIGVGQLLGEASEWYEVAAVFAAMFSGGALGAFLGSQLGIALEDSSSRANSQGS